MAVFTGKPYGLSYQAATDVETLVLTQEVILETLQHFPDMKKVIEGRVGLQLDENMSILQQKRESETIGKGR